MKKRLPSASVWAHRQCNFREGNLLTNFVKSLVSKYDMPVCITHDKFDRVENDLDGLIAEHKIYGCNNLGIGMMPKKFRTGKLEDLQKFVDFLNATADRLAKEGMTMSYHNHWFEFDEVEGHIVYDYLIENTDKRVGFIPDTFWMVFAGKDVCRYLEKLDGRVNTLQLKDYKHKVFRAIGKVTLDFKTILKKRSRSACKTLSWNSTCRQIRSRVCAFL